MEVGTRLGSPVESSQVLRNGGTFECLWYEGYTVLIIASQGRVIGVHSVFM